MRKGRGLVMEIKKRSCIVLDSDGLFVEVPKPRLNVQIGQEIEFERPVARRFKAHHLAVASLLVAVVAWLVYSAMLPRAVAYVALDINPSVELGVDNSVKIVSARGLNKDGETVLEGASILHEPLREGLQQIIDRCIDYKYLDLGKDNMILATVTDVWSENREVIASEDVYEYISKPINDSGVNADIIIARTDYETLQKAHNIGITPGRYLIQKQALKHGVLINDKEIHTDKIQELEEKRHFRTEDLIKKWRPKRSNTDKPGDKASVEDQIPGGPQMLPGSKEIPARDSDRRSGKSDYRGTKPQTSGEDEENIQNKTPSKPDNEPHKEVINPGVNDYTPGDDPERPGKGNKVREKSAGAQDEVKNTKKRQYMERENGREDKEKKSASIMK